MMRLVEAIVVLAFASSCGGSQAPCGDWCQTQRGWRERCDRNDAEACASLENYGRACELGLPRGCVAAAKAIDPDQTIIDPDPARALTLYGRACDLGALDACARAAELALASGDAKRARTWLEPACTKGSGASCRMLAYDLEAGAGGAIDEKRAIEVMELACNLQVVDACAELAFFHYAGIGGPREDVLAGPRFAEACAKGASDACQVEKLLRDESVDNLHLIGLLLEADDAPVVLHRSEQAPPPGIDAQLLTPIAISGTVSASGWMTAVQGRVTMRNDRRLRLVEQRSANILRMGYTRRTLVQVEWEPPRLELKDADCASAPHCQAPDTCRADEGYCVPDPPKRQ